MQCGCAVNRQRTPLVAANSALSLQGACIRICHRILHTKDTRGNRRERFKSSISRQYHHTSQAVCVTLPVCQFISWGSVLARWCQVDVARTTSCQPKGQIGVNPLHYICIRPKLVSLPQHQRRTYFNSHNILLAQRRNRPNSAKNNVRAWEYTRKLKPLQIFSRALQKLGETTQFQTVAVNIVEFHLTASVNRLHQCLSGYIACECSGPDMNGLHWAAVGGTSRGRRVMAQGPLFLHSPVSFSFWVASCLQLLLHKDTKILECSDEEETSSQASKLR